MTGGLDTDHLDTDLVVHRYGRPGAPAFLLLHGLTEAGTTWPDLVAHLGQDWDVVAPDQRGHGRSPRFTDEQYVFPTGVMLADAVALLEQCGPAVVYGHSLGGIVALRAAATRPDLVRALVLEDPAKPIGSWEPTPEFVEPTVTFLDAMEHPEAELERMRRETPWSERELLAWAACKPLVDRRYVREGTFLGDGAWEEIFDALTVPTLLLLPPDAEMAPRAELVTNPLVERLEVPGAGHCVRRDRPDQVHSALDNFLARHAPPPR